MKLCYKQLHPKVQPGKCPECRRAYMREQNRRPHVVAMKRRYSASEKRKAAMRVRDAGADARAAKRAWRRGQVVPAWADAAAMVSIYAAVTESQHVDHTVPITSALVVGFHCPANLRVVDATENKSKSNRTWPDAGVTSLAALRPDEQAMLLAWHGVRRKITTENYSRLGAADLQRLAAFLARWQLVNGAWQETH